MPNFSICCLQPSRDRAISWIIALELKVYAVTGQVSVIFIALGISLWTSVALAQTLMSEQAFDETQLRQELERIEKSSSNESATAKKILDVLNEPTTSLKRRSTLDQHKRKRRIVNGLATYGHSAVGVLLLKGTDSQAATIKCTGTLVGSDKFLTAAHCISDLMTGSSYLVFLQELGFFEIKEKIFWEPTKYDNKNLHYDIAMLTLKRPACGIAPIAINENLAAPAINRIGTIVGFGRTGGSRIDYGIKRMGTVEIKMCAGDHDPKVFCAAFSASLKPKDSASNICGGDSGGGVFMTDKDDRGQNIDKIFGVVSGNSTKECGAEAKDKDTSYYQNLFDRDYQKWLKIAGEGRLSSRVCGNEEIYDTKHTILAIKDSEYTDISLQLPAGTENFRVAMNADVSGQDNKNDFDLLVFSDPTMPKQPESICEVINFGQFAFCEMKNGKYKDWKIRIVRKKGAGLAQITTSFFREVTATSASLNLGK